MENFPLTRSPSEAAFETEISSILDNDTRLSLAYGGFEEVPHLVLKLVAQKIENLDLSHNCFKDLSFLKHFPHLQTLVLDENSNLDHQTLPYMENLENISLNNCDIDNATDWLKTLSAKCPALQDLSMTCNSMDYTTLDSFSELEEIQDSSQIQEILPNLEYFNNTLLTDEAKKSKKFLLNFVKVCRKKTRKIINFTKKKVNGNN